LETHTVIRQHKLLGQAHARTHSHADAHTHTYSHTHTHTTTIIQQLLISVRGFQFRQRYYMHFFFLRPTANKDCKTEFSYREYK